MSLKDNEYFKNIRKKLEEYTIKLTEWNNQKTKILFSELSLPEIDRWLKENPQPKNPVSLEGRMACLCWINSVYLSLEEMEVENFVPCKTEETQGFVSVLRNAGIETFVYTGRSTVTTDDIINLLSAGCVFEGVAELTKIRRYETNNEWTETEIVTGLRFRIGGKDENK